ncbi:hypothetical protein LXG23DRAFT_55535 [Yarrowia lipolytica]|nr:hypothetical protein LXG23DRAFT_55535 [Yarrowia lipolytica]
MIPLVQEEIKKAGESEINAKLYPYLKLITENLATMMTEDDESFVKKYMPEPLKEFFGNQQMDVFNRYAN